MRTLRKRVEQGDHSALQVLEKCDIAYKEQKTKVTNLIWEAKVKDEKERIVTWKELPPWDRERGMEVYEKLTQWTGDEQTSEVQSK